MKVLHVDTGDRVDSYPDPTRWQTAGELAVYGADGELVAVHAEGHWVKAHVEEVDGWPAESV